MGRCRSSAMMVITVLFAFGVFAEESSTISSGEVTDNLPAPISLIPTENPHSKALGQRIAGGVLCGLGGVNLAMGIICKTGRVFENMYADLDMRETGEMFDNIIWIEGAVMLGIAIPLAIVGRVKYGQWKEWEHEHETHAYLQGNTLTIEF